MFLCCNIVYRIELLSANKRLAFSIFQPLACVATPQESGSNMVDGNKTNLSSTSCTVHRQKDFNSSNSNSIPIIMFLELSMLGDRG